MKKIVMATVIAFVLSGCVTVRKTQEPLERKGEGLDLMATSPELENIKKEELDQYAQKKGVIFAKTEFKGVLEAKFIRFLFEDLDDPAHQFRLHIGEKSSETTFPWGGKTVQPGYFFVELPAGRYKISSVSIPVGSTLATEEMNVALEVFSDEVCYAGTLKMVGTKEKIKLGGLPLFKPGFDFTVEILDQREEGLEAFKKNYPNYPQEISIKLMRVIVDAPEKMK